MISVSIHSHPHALIVQILQILSLVFVIRYSIIEES